MKVVTKAELYRSLPSVDELLRGAELEQLILQEGSVCVTDACRSVLERLRQEITEGGLDENTLPVALSGIVDAVTSKVRANLRYTLRQVINATGVILHTNLGRAPLTSAAIEHLEETATYYSNLEFDIESGERGKRDVHVDGLFSKLLASARDLSTIVVNNNAAAVLLALNTLAEGGEVIVSRGELVEIGGSFRIPEIMAKSGATLREVGTTNRTRISDYTSALTERTRLLLRVHRSNFEIRGFTEQPALGELVELGQRQNIPILEDLGSGALFDLSQVGIHGEPDVLESLRSGVDVVTYSGDKLLGGPQAGVVSGRKDLVAKMRSNSLFRALRVDKLTYAALEATLLAYVKGNHEAIPALRMMRLSKAEISSRAETIRTAVELAELKIDLLDGESLIGGGAAPSAVLPTRLIALTHAQFTADQVAARLRRCDRPIITRVEDGRVLLDLRTVFPEQDEYVRNALRSHR